MDWKNLLEEQIHQGFSPTGLFGLELGHVIIDCIDQGTEHLRRIDPDEADLADQIIAATIYGLDRNGFAHALLDFDPALGNDVVRQSAQELLFSYSSIQKWGIRDLLID